MSTTPQYPRNPENPAYTGYADPKHEQNQDSRPIETAPSKSTSTNTESARVVEMSGRPRSHPLQEQEEEPRESGRRVTILLLILLVISVGMNFSLARQQRDTATRSAELEVALSRAMERMDQETQRANNAEGTLADVDRNVDTVQERIAELQSALSALSKATAR